MVQGIFLEDAPTNTVARFRQLSKDKWSASALDDTLVVHHHLSGDTHILNFLSATLFELIGETPMGLQECAPAAREVLGFDDQHCPDFLVARSLDELDEAGLILPVVE